MDKNINQEKTTALTFPVILADKTAAMVFAGIFSLSFFVPFFLGHPQWLVGTIVNACLFLTAIFLPKKFFLPLIIFPSLGVLARGLVFGPFTPFLIYFLPFIWLGNLVLILISAANIYFKFHIVPQMFLQAMGQNQLLTALAGGIISFIILQFLLLNQNYERNNTRSQRIN
ncbi:MAG: hypothetical protein AAB361_00675 [Patescibacteria group bacterium]